MPLLTYDEFIEYCRNRQDANTNPIIAQFLSRYRQHHYNESGHFKQAYYATLLFYLINPAAKETIRNLPPDQPVDLQNNQELLEDWRYFLSEYRGDRSKVLGFDIEVLYRGLHQNLGGQLTTGGGAGYPLKIILRLVADIP